MHYAQQQRADKSIIITNLLISADHLLITARHPRELTTTTTELEGALSAPNSDFDCSKTEGSHSLVTMFLDVDSNRKTVKTPSQQLSQEHAALLKDTKVPGDNVAAFSTFEACTKMSVPPFVRCNATGPMLLIELPHAAVLTIRLIWKGQLLRHRSRLKHGRRCTCDDSWHEL